MKFFYILFSIAFLSPMGYAQSSTDGDKIYHITYNVLFSGATKDINSPTMPYQGHLITKGENSFFCFNSTPETYKVENKTELHSVVIIDTLFKVVKFTSAQEVVFEGNIGLTKRIYRDTLYPMQWAITGAKKQIGQQQCLQATTFFKGRSYTAWYNPEIPIFDGPWKLGGLPGLIVEAQDDEGLLKFEMATMKSVDTLPPFAKIIDTKSINLSRIPSYEKYIADFTKIYKTDIESHKAGSDGNCLTCPSTTKTSLTITTWEKVFNL